METIRSFLRIVDHQTIIVAVLSLLSTYLCSFLNLAANMPTGLIGVAIIFPIVFSINAAYRRRENALKYFASLKAHAMALYYAHRHWVPGNHIEDAERIKGLIETLLINMLKYFTKDEIAGEAPRDIYRIFSEISKSHETLRAKHVPANEISRANQYLRAMIIEFERMRNILLYRTPISLRSYSRIFLNTFPVLFGPYFAYLSTKFYPAVGYVVAIFYSLVLVSLDNIQEDLENPFDGVGDDDVKLNIVDEYSAIMEDE